MLHAFLQTPDPRPKASRPAWRWLVRLPKAPVLPWSAKVWLSCEVLHGVLLHEPHWEAHDADSAQQMVATVRPNFDGDILFVPGAVADDFLDFLEAFSAVFMEGRTTVEWRGHKWPVDSWNPAVRRGQVIGWRRSSRGAWAIAAEASAGAFLLPQALSLFDLYRPVEGVVLGEYESASPFDDRRAWLLSAPRLSTLLSLPAARRDPALFGLLEAALEDGFLSMGTVLAVGPDPDCASPIDGYRIALDESVGTPPEKFCQWLDAWGARSVMQDLHPDIILTREAPSPPFAAASRQPAALFREWVEHSHSTAG